MFYVMYQIAVAYNVISVKSICEMPAFLSVTFELLKNDLPDISLKYSKFRPDKETPCDSFLFSDLLYDIHVNSTYTKSNI